MAASSRLPSTWAAPLPGRRVNIVDLDPAGQEYLQIKHDVVASKFACQIHEIKRIENPDLWELYSAMKDVMIRRNGPQVVNERNLWHGTTLEDVYKVARDGFQRNFCDEEAALGRAVYFAVKPGYAARQKFAMPEDDDMQYIIYCYVLTGRFCEGKKGLFEPKELPDRSGLYDSLVERTNDPTMFAVTHDCQSYPAYIVQLKRYSYDKDKK